MNHTQQGSITTSGLLTSFLCLNVLFSLHIDDLELLFSLDVSLFAVPKVALVDDALQAANVEGIAMGGVLGLLLQLLLLLLCVLLQEREQLFDAVVLVFEDVLPRGVEGVDFDVPVFIVAVGIIFVGGDDVSQVHGLTDVELEFSFGHARLIPGSVGRIRARVVVVVVHK